MDSLLGAIQSIDTRYVDKALSTIMSEHLQYELKAWIEGCYARHCGQGRDKCRYRHGTAMARAWLKGWHYQEGSSSRPKSVDQPDVSQNLGGPGHLAV
jgi:hypothetical protein